MNNELYSFIKAISLIALGVTAFSFGALLFAFIDKAFPDPLQFGEFAARELTTALAALIIAFPLYVVLSWRLAKTAAGRSGAQEPTIAKWLTYIVLIGVAAIILGDLIAVLAEFLRGELTTRFVLKALSILIIASSIFGYYLWKLQQPKNIPLPSEKVLGLVTAGIIIVAVGYGLTLAGSPGEQRLAQFDERRISDLRNISFAVDAYWEKNGALPEELEDLQGTRAFVRSIQDPKTEAQYEYSLLSETTYELCAEFETDSSLIQEPFPKPFSEQIWEHGIGRTCFELEAQDVAKGEPVPVPVR